MSYEFYKVLHLTSIFGIFLSLGALSFHIMAGGTKVFPQRKWVMITHGLGMLIAFVAGFGLIARLQLQTPWPMWIWLKLVIWLILGFIVGVIPRFPKFAKIIWIGILVLGGCAAYLARVKPF